MSNNIKEKHDLKETVGPDDPMITDDINQTTAKSEDNAASVNTGAIKLGSTESDFVCKWVDCDARYYLNLTSLVEHLNSTHLAHIAHLTPTIPIRYTCQWENCSRFGIEQPSRFALISHCRTHTGEKPYFCPIPECEKHFTRSDALAKHVKGVHDLHSIKDALIIIKEKVKKNKMEPIVDDLQNLTEFDYLALIEKDYELKNPWWFSNTFIDILKEGDTSLETILNQPFNTRQFEIANSRYQPYLGKNYDHSEVSDNITKEDSSESNFTYSAIPVDEDLQKIEETNDFQELQNMHYKLKQNLATAKKINKLVTTQLSASIKEKRKLWLVNQILIDANSMLGLPKDINAEENQEHKISLDKFDKELIKDITR